MLALHKECLTHRCLLGRLDFLLGFFGFGLGTFHAYKGLRKFRLLRLVVTLQGLELPAELLELLLYLAHPSILLFALNAAPCPPCLRPWIALSSGTPLRSWPLLPNHDTFLGTPIFSILCDR